MAYEIINNAQINPPRLHALLRLVAANPNIQEEKILTLLQPKPLNTNQSAAKEILDAAVKTKLIRGDNQKRYQSELSYEDIETYQGFRIEMQQRLLGVVKAKEDNYLLNQFAAWYAVKGAAYLSKTSSVRGDMAADFNEDLYRDSEERILNATKLGGMDDWLEFLGFGWRLDNFFLIPDASSRIEPLLDKLLPSTKEIEFAKFMAQLSELCPELDRGVLFERCRQAVFGNKRQGNEISLMLSTALRTLRHEQRIRLIYSHDAKDTWLLYPDVSDSNTQVTHIARMRNPNGR